MAVDESFKRPGAIPFKWEISPGIPKPQQDALPSPPHPTKLTPPPSAPTFSPNTSPRLLQFTSNSPSGSRRFHGGNRHSPSRDRSPSFFILPELTRAREKVTHEINYKSILDENNNDNGDDNDDEDNTTENMLTLQTLARWSMSTRKSLSPDSPLLSSSLSESLRRNHDTDWAGYGLF